MAETTQNMPFAGIVTLRIQGHTNAVHSRR